MGIPRQEWEEARQEHIQEVRREMWGIKIWDSTGVWYYTNIDISHSVQHNRPTVSQLAFNSQYPFHIHNGKPSYYSGSCTASFSEDANYDETDDDCIEMSEEELDNIDWSEDYIFAEDGSVIYNSKYVNSFVKWLHNDKIKYLQLTKSIIIPIGIMGEIQWDCDYNIQNGESIKVSFNWEQLNDEYYGNSDNV